MNNITKKIAYNLRMIVDVEDVDMIPRAWQVSKINRINPAGVITVTLAQDEFNKEKDCFGYDENGNYFAYADYYSSAITPKDYSQKETSSGVRVELTYANKPQIKVGGNYKTITVFYYDADGVDITDKYTIDQSNFKFLVDGEDISNDLDIKLTDNKIKLKYIGNKFNIGKVIDVNYKDNTISNTTKLEISAL